MKKKILLILSLFTFISPILFAQAPDSLVGKKLSLNFEYIGGALYPEASDPFTYPMVVFTDIGGELFITDSVISVGNFHFNTNGGPNWENYHFHYKKISSDAGLIKIFLSNDSWMELDLKFTSSNSLSSPSVVTLTQRNSRYNGTGDVTITDLAISEIATSYQPNVLTSDFAPTSIAAGSLSAQDKYWHVYDENITFSTSGTFNANITNGSDNPTGSGNYTYTYTGTNSAILSYSIDGAGYSFEYALQFSGENTGIYSKFADYGGGSTDITTGPFSLSGVAIPEQFDLTVRSRSIWASRDLVYLQTPSGPTEIEGAGEIDFWAELIEHPSVTQLNLSVNGSSYDLRQQEAPNGFRTRFEYDSGYGELFDLESASDSDWSPYINATTFTFSMTVNGAQYSYSHNLPAESELPQPTNVSFNGDYSWKLDNEGYDYVEILKNDSYQFSWDTFSTTDTKDYIVVHVQELVGDDDEQVVSEVVLDAGETSYTVDGSYFEAGKKYSFYVELMNVTEQQNPGGFTHTSGSDRSLPLLQTTARMVSVLDFVVIEGKVVVSDSSGLPVVVQVGDEYKWNSTLDGVTLWSVSGSESEDDWYALTAKFSGGKLIYGFEFADDVSDTGANSVTYEIDANGYIKSLEGDGDYQYYNVVSVENGVIGTIQNDQGVESVADNGINQVDQWFFTTRSAAEEYYYSKVNPKDWMWFDHYPWVYSEGEQGWLYFYPSGSKLLYYSNKNKAWREFSQ